MKTQIILAALAASLLTLCASCNKVSADTPDICPPASETSCGTASFLITGCGLPETKASDTGSTSAESAVSNVQILIFDANGNVASYIDAGKATSASARLKQGTYSARAIVNGPSLSGIKTLDELNAVGIALADWNSPSSDFVMSDPAATSVTVEMNKEVSVAITVSRFVTRVRLASVTNNCPAALGNVVLKRAFLSNVVCNQNIGGGAAPSDWTNIYGRSNASDSNSVIDGSNYLAVPAELTYTSWTGGNAVTHGSTADIARSLYSYPNSSTDCVTEWKSAFTATSTRLVLVAEVNGKDFYYPVSLPATVRNSSCDVTVTITGEGLDDPQDDPRILKEKGTVKVGVTVAPWTAGSEYNLEY